jgi:hypothetical protein
MSLAQYLTRRSAAAVLSVAVLAGGAVAAAPEIRATSWQYSATAARA